MNTTDYIYIYLPNIILTMVYFSPMVEISSIYLSEDVHCRSMVIFNPVRDVKI